MKKYIKSAYTLISFVIMNNFAKGNVEYIARHST